MALSEGGGMENEPEVVPEDETEAQEMARYKREDEFYAKTWVSLEDLERTDDEEDHSARTEEEKACYWDGVIIGLILSIPIGLALYGAYWLGWWLYWSYAV